MYKRLLSLALVGSGVLAAGAAQASHTFSLFPFETGKGVWNVQINQATNVTASNPYRSFKITNATKSFRAGDLAPVTDADQIVVQFFTGLKHPINPDCTGDVVGGVIVTGTALTFPTKTGGTGGAWTTLGGIRARFRNNTDPSIKETTELNKNGKNAFKEGTGEIQVHKNLVKCFTVQVTNFGGQFQDSDEAFVSYDHIAVNLWPDAAPEASSLALMLPALLPLGIVLRRRNRR